MATKKEKLAQAIKQGKIRDDKSAFAFVLEEKKKEELIQELLPEIKQIQRGDKGDPGKDGYTPVKNKDYFDGENGYTPIKGKDYFDGDPGKPGVPGKSPNVSTVVSEATKQVITALEPLIPTIEQISNQIPVLSNEVRDALELLTGDERLDASAIKNLPKPGQIIGGGSTARSLYQLLDVHLTAPANGETLIYNSATNQWENGISSGGTWGSITGTITDQTDLINYLTNNYYPLSTNPAGYLTAETDPLFQTWLQAPFFDSLVTFNDDIHANKDLYLGGTLYASKVVADTILSTTLKTNDLYAGYAKITDLDLGNQILDGSFQGKFYGDGRGLKITELEPQFTDWMDNPHFLHALPGFNIDGDVYQLGTFTTGSVLTNTLNVAGLTNLSDTVINGELTLTQPLDGFFNGIFQGDFYGDGGGLYGNISQWTNDVGYITSFVGLPSYHTVTVGATDCAFTVIQDAIDYCVAQSPTQTDQWNVIIYPGDYNENLVFGTWVNLINMGGGAPGDSGVIVHATNALATTTDCTVTGIDFVLDPGAGGTVSMVVGGAITGYRTRCVFENCKFLIKQTDTQTATEIRIIDIEDTGEIFLHNCVMSVRCTPATTCVFSALYNNASGRIYVQNLALTEFSVVGTTTGQYFSYRTSNAVGHLDTIGDVVFKECMDFGGDPTTNFIFWNDAPANGGCNAFGISGLDVGVNSTVVGGANKQLINFGGTYTDKIHSSNQQELYDVANRTIWSHGTNNKMLEWNTTVTDPTNYGFKFYNWPLRDTAGIYPYYDNITTAYGADIGKTTAIYKNGYFTELDVYAPTNGKGRLVVKGTDNTSTNDVTLTNRLHGSSRTHYIQDSGDDGTFVEYCNNSIFNGNSIATVSPFTVFTPSITGLYRINYYAEVTTTGAGTMTCTVGWTDDARAQTNVSGAVVTTAKNYIQGCIVMRCVATNAITFGVQMSGATCTINYYGTVEKIYN